MEVQERRFRGSAASLISLVSVLGSAAIVALMLHVVLNVGLRYARGEGLPGTIDIVSNWWIVAIAFAGLGQVQLAGQHIEVTMLTARLTGSSRRAGRTLIAFVTAAVAAAIGWFGLVTAIEHTERGEVAAAEVSVPIWPARFLVPLGMLMLLIACIVQLVGLWRDDDPPDNLNPVALDDGGVSTDAGVGTTRD